ncbi:MAG: NAD-dependent epimerase/dehydratase family protein [Thermoguttaceae bacterium]
MNHSAKDLSREIPCEALPDAIENVEQLDELLSRPTPEVVATMGRIDGDMIVLGVGGKIGPSLARMARRASDAAGVRRRIIGVSRFSKPELQNSLESHGVETIRCDLLEADQLAALPEASNVLYLAAMKFGTTGQEASTWARNVHVPGLVCQRFRQSRIVAYSTGNVYPLTRPERGGSVESDATGPVGEYAMSCLGRERVFAYFSQTLGIPITLIRLNYATEMRYGVLVDIAVQVMAGEPINLAMGYFNAIWQGDNNAMTLRALEQTASPPTVLNIAGPQILSVRQVAEEFGRLFDRPVRFVGTEAPDALLSNASLASRLFGKPRVRESQLIRWIAGWRLHNGSTLNKPTHFEVRDGGF